jgi:hypothetical protein
MMPVPGASHDVIEEVSALFWKPPSLDELMASIAPLGADESFEIEDLTDEEWPGLRRRSRRVMSSSTGKSRYSS